MTEKTILCYGDSNTWGYIPQTGERYDGNIRWTRRLADALGNGYYVVEEGLNGRTTAFDDPIEPHRNGHRSLEGCLLSHKPIDLFIVMLGTNDTKHFLRLTPLRIAKGIDAIVKGAGSGEYGRGGEPPKILVISPIHIEPSGFNDHIRQYFDDESAAKSRALAYEYELVAQQYGCSYMDASKHAKASLRDGIHMEPEDHLSLSEAVADRVRKLLGSG